MYFRDIGKYAVSHEGHSFIQSKWAVSDRRRNSHCCSDDRFGVRTEAEARTQRWEAGNLVPTSEKLFKIRFTHIEMGITLREIIKNNINKGQRELWHRTGAWS